MSAAELAEYLALLEERDRRRAREDFLSFYMRMTGFRPPKHFRVIARLLQSMEEDRVDRAMIFAPPRHIKTLGATILFPAWIMGRHPRTSLMSVVHTQDYARKIGRKVRNLLRHPAWPFDHVQLSDDSQAREHWTTPQGGEYNGFGANAGNQHGNPAEWLFNDDIVKGRKIAMSAHMRDEIWDNYRADFTSRLQGRRKQLMVFTRWHNDDPAGRILPEDFDGRTGWYSDRETEEKWFVLSMPAVCEHDKDPVGRQPGEWLWPEAFGDKQLGGTRTRGGWIWSSLYQQRPSPEEGLMFTADHIQHFDLRSLNLSDKTIYGSSDYAVTAEAGAYDPDYTVHLIWAVDSDFNLYLIGGWRGRTESDMWVAHFIRLVKQHKPLRWVEESGQILKGVGPFLRQQMRQERVYVDRVQLTSSENKEQRAQALLGTAAMGKFYLPSKSTIDDPEFLKLVEALEVELLQFPGGKHDDTVDACTIMGRMVDRIIEGQPVRKQPFGRGSPHGQTLDDLWNEHDDSLMKRERDQ